MISLLAAAATLPPFMISLLATAAALSPKLVSLYGFAFGCRCRLVPQAFKSPFLIILFSHDFPFLFCAALDCCPVFQLVPFHAFS